MVSEREKERERKVTVRECKQMGVLKLGDLGKPNLQKPNVSSGIYLYYY